MTPINGLEILFFAGLIFGLTPVVGRYLAAIFRLGETDSSLTRFRQIDATILKWIGISPTQEMSWKSYTVAVLQFHLIGFLVLVGMQMFQAGLPLNPSHLPNVSWHLAFNTAASFVTNTNWQAYAGETTLSQWVQMVGLGVQNFLSAAAGIAVLFALIRGLIYKQVIHLGNFWADIWRITAYILVPLSTKFAVGLVSQGVIQNFSAPFQVTTVEGKSQVLPQGPVASQIAIKQLGTNGGGYFNANSSHPYENPTPLYNFLEMLAIILIPSSLVWMFGELVGNRRHGWVIWGVMAGILAIGVSLALYSETQGITGHLGMANWEGKETRFGISASVLWSGLTTAASNGSINAAMSSLSPIAGGVALFNKGLIAGNRGVGSVRHRSSPGEIRLHLLG
ncbi:potassium-transporting ATPase subunit A [bacterium]|nr:potassium-transporting ATPase subunit A [bacterium]